MANLKELDAIFDRILTDLENPDAPEGNPFENLAVMEDAPRFRSVLPITVKAAKNGLSASVYVAAPERPNNRFSLGELHAAIRKKGIKAGIDEKLLEKMAEEQLYNTEVVFASGKPAINGINGSVQNLLEPETDISEGEVICRIIPAEKGSDGFDIYGNTLKSVNGYAPDIPQGFNTCLNRDHTALVAAATGKLKLRDGVFSVRDEMVVEGDVFRSVHPTAYTGDLIIMGNVNEGAIVNAGGSVHVHGKVTKANVSGKKIIVDDAVTGSYLTARSGGITVDVCSGSTLEAEGNIEASSIMNSKVSCAGMILCLTNPGRISGGTVRAIGGIECLVAGNYMHDLTEIIVGDCFEYTEERKALDRQIAAIDTQLERLALREEELKEKKAVGKITKEESDFLKTTARVKLQQAVEKEPLQNRLELVNGIIERAEAATLEIGVALHTNVTLVIGGHTRIIATEYGKSTVSANELGVVIA